MPRRRARGSRASCPGSPAARYPRLVSVGVTDRPVLAGVLGALVIAFSAILVRLAEVSPSTAAFFRCLYALPLLALLAWHERRRFGMRSWRDRRLAWAAGLFFAGDLTFWHHSIGAVGAGLATVLGNTQVVFVAVLAWAALGERAENRSLVADPDRVPRRHLDLGRDRQRRLRRRPGAGRGVRRPHRDHVRALYPDPAPREQ